MALISNFFPISFVDERFQINRIEYSTDKLRNLRKDHNNTNSFFRNEDFIYISPMQGQKLGIGTTTTLEIQKDTKVVSSLIKHIFFRTFRDKYPDIIPLDFYPFRILSRKKGDNLIADKLPPDLRGILAFKKLIEIQFRTVQVDNKNQFGAVINIHYQWQFNKNCSQLKNEGFNISGFSVLTSEQIPGLEDVLAPDESLVGIVKKFEGENAVVETNNGNETFKLEELFLHKSIQNIRDYLEFKLGTVTTNQIFSIIHERDRTRLNAKSYLNEIKELAKTISGFRYENIDGFAFKISDLPQTVTRKFSIQPTSFIFDYNPGATHDNPNKGLVNFGPYDSSTFGFLIYFIRVNPQQAETITRILTFLPFIGFSGSVIPVITYRNKIIDFFKKPFFTYYNFKPEKIK